jgi:hypothetical protein
MGQEMKLLWNGNRLHLEGRKGAVCFFQMQMHMQARSRAMVPTEWFNHPPRTLESLNERRANHSRSIVRGIELFTSSSAMCPSRIQNPQTSKESLANAGQILATCTMLALM